MSIMNNVPTSLIQKASKSKIADEINKRHIWAWNQLPVRVRDYASVPPPEMDRDWRGNSGRRARAGRDILNLRLSPGSSPVSRFSPSVPNHPGWRYPKNWNTKIYKSGREIIKQVTVLIKAQMIVLQWNKLQNWFDTVSILKQLRGGVIQWVTPHQKYAAW